MSYRPSSRTANYVLIALAATMVATGVWATPFGLMSAEPAPQAIVDADFAALRPTIDVNRTRKGDRLPGAQEVPVTKTITILRTVIAPDFTARDINRARQFEI
jgi:hypothetical protein